MDYFTKKKRQIHPRESNNWIAVLFFIDAWKLFKKGFRKDLEEGDLYENISWNRSEDVGNRLEKAVEGQKKINSTISLIKVLMKTYGWYFIFLGMIQLAQDVAIVLIEPYCLSKIVAYFTPGQKDLTRKDVLFYSALMVGFNTSICLYRHNYLLASESFSIRVRTALSSLIYRKILKIRPENIEKITFGKAVTIITKDLNTFVNFLYVAHDLYVSFIRLIVIGIVLYLKVGTPALSGVGYFLIAVPIQVAIGWRIKNMKNQMFKRTDERLYQTQEALSAIKIIKMYVWETFFIRKISSSRKRELQSTYKIFFMRYLVLTFSSLHAHMAFYVLIITYLWFGYTLTAEVIYYIQNIFHTLSTTMSYYFPTGIYYTAELIAALNRIESILNLDEVESGDEKSYKEPSVSLEHVTITNGNAVILENVNLKFTRGLNLVTGRVGSGKSFLLKTLILGYKPECGKIIIDGKLSYASQEPWLFPSTIRQNIIFVEEFDKERYEKVLRVCALHYDLSILPKEDQTIIEDRGINLSKGQQARISLARAIYSKSDIYLLDDCLSALDTTVSQFIFQECIQKFLKGKIVVLVSHNRNYISEADNFIILNGAHCEAQLLAHENINLPEDIIAEDAVRATEETHIVESREENVYEEFRQIGKVSFEAYKKYFRYVGGFLPVFITAALFILAQLSVSYNDKLLSNWANFEQVQANMSNMTAEEIDIERTYLSRTYSIITAVGAAATLAKSMALFFLARKSSTVLHNQIISSVMNAPMNFYDQHYIGNIINRFSKDLKTIDEDLPLIYYYLFNEFLVSAGILSLIVSVKWYFILPSLFFLGVLLVLRNYCIKTVRSLKRLEATTRSPVIGYLNATIEGIITIRASNAERILRKEFDQHQDLYTSANFNLFCTMRAMSYVTETIASLFVALVVINFLIFEDVAGNVGLAISQALLLVSTLQFVVMISTNLESEMTAVERVLEYANIEQEHRDGLELDTWPRAGEISYKNVSLDYTENDKILKNLHLAIKSKEKLGIIGRTGAGKSSIISTLFRMYDIKGNILIDDIDIKTLSLDFLRKNIAIIPQDPVLFNGTIRENLDPNGEKTDADIWKAIESSNLKSLIPNLDLVISENSSFSLGQKQLLCLSRALIRKNKIVVLDEATANMDEETSKLIEQTILDNFNNCTVLIVAHNLHSILNLCSKVIVMEQGQIVNFGEAKTLLTNANKFFGNISRNSTIL